MDRGQEIVKNGLRHNYTLRLNMLLMSNHVPLVIHMGGHNNYY